MKSKTMISIMLMAAFSVFAIVGSAGISVGIGKVQAYTSADLGEAAASTYRTVHNLKIIQYAVETCTNQLTPENTSSMDACISMSKIFDQHLTDAVAEASNDIAKITGNGSAS